MRNKTILRKFTVVLAVFALTSFIAETSAAAQTEKLLHSFVENSKDAADAYAGVVVDKAGNLYGTTAAGGVYNEGAVYKLKPKGRGWTEAVLHSFRNNGTDGYSPTTALILDASGNLYGVTGSGGAYGDGTAFELSPSGSGEWTETVLFNFNYSTGGGHPDSAMIFDALGNLYGTTAGGGSGTGCNEGCGTVFQLVPQSGGGWSANFLYSFSNNGIDGYGPLGLIFDGKGNLYGTCPFGGTDGQGVVWELSPQAGGSWTETILHSFVYNGTDGAYPEAGVIVDSAGNLYGTTQEGGAYSGAGGGGTVFELINTKSGWEEKILFSFNNLSSGPFYPLAAVTFDSSGNLYGTTSKGGTYGWGTVFELKPAHGGSWVETIAHSFGDETHFTDGLDPVGSVVFDAAGNLYGVTYYGGKQDVGTVFEIMH